jgi:hypothetical protein
MSQVWQLVRAWTGADFPTPRRSFTSTEEWWLQVRKRAPKTLRHGFDAAMILVHWRIWKEWNSRVFQNVQHSVEDVFEMIRAWCAEGRVVAV